MKIWIPFVLVLTLGGCAGLGGLAGGLLGSFGGVATQVVEQKIAARAVWKARHKEMGDEVIRVYRDAAAQERTAGNFGAVLKYLKEALAFHMTMRPEFLVEKAFRPAVD